ncbi:MAG: hypothetical protein IPL65_16080 [Lewinellaceae bacterium]|nr:hypothetical protein [Lewinellaceae bacterium]
MVLSLTLGAYYNRFGFGDFIQNNHWLLYAITVVLGVLMVSELPLAGLKISGFRWRGNEALLLLLLLFALLLWAVQELAFALIVVAYIAYSIAFRKKKPRTELQSEITHYEIYCRNRRHAP